MSTPLVPSRKQINPLLEKYLDVLIRRPILTKAVTAALLNFAGENIARSLSGAPPEPYQKTGIAPVDFVKSNKRAFKLSAYGFLVSAPLAHFLVGTLQKAFAGKTSARDRLLLLVVNNLTVAPIQGAAYLAFLSYLGGKRHIGDIIAFVRSQMPNLMRTTWVVSPLSVFFAQRFLMNEIWVPFFSLINFVLGTYINTKVKRQQVAGARAKKEAEDRTKDL